MMCFIPPSNGTTYSNGICLKVRLFLIMDYTSLQYWVCWIPWLVFSGGTTGSKSHVTNIWPAKPLIAFLSYIYYTRGKPAKHEVKS
jgi:hypothetical protein